MVPVTCGNEARLCPISQGPCPGECIFARVMESQALGVVVLDLAGQSMIFANRSARALLAHAELAADYPTLHRLFIPAGGEEPSGAESRPEPLRLGTRLIGFTRYREGPFAWFLVRDITAKARLESIAEAVESMNNIGYVFSAVRHELGNPVNSIKAALSVLRANLETYSLDTVAEYLDLLSGEVGRLENLLRSLRTFSLYERPEITDVEMEAFLRAFASLVSAECRRRALALAVDVPRDVWAACDPRALQQVLLNLFANAADAVERCDEPRIRLSAGNADGLVTLRFEDNGCGMDAEQLRNLFRPFHTTKERGTGLGLVISRKMITRMSGTISLESAPEVGTAVTITLPERRRAA
jgi:signal transduction histidine kinase